MTDAYIESFIRAFEHGSLSRAEWTHSRHLVLALWYLRRHKREEATRLIRDGIQRHNETQENFTGYHETITLAWVAVVERFLAERDIDLPMSVLVGELLGQCGDKNYLPAILFQGAGSSVIRRELRGCRKTSLRLASR